MEAGKRARLLLTCAATSSSAAHSRFFRRPEPLTRCGVEVSNGHARAASCTHRRLMRTYTLVASIVAHVTVACAVLFSTVIATDELPEPRRTSVFVEVMSVPSPTPPPAARPRVVQPASTAVVPLGAPIGVHPEIDRPAVPDVFDPVPYHVFVG